ncbi:MAG: hypothetical protein Ta2A_12470 [Treponemataceae bacterium]|nr:MAG: hypothetical protein Ta2A_12470 [Treponemataceae bacterium]
MSNRIVVHNATTDKNLIFRKIRVKKSLDEICHSLEMELASSEFGKIHKHDKIEVRFVNPFMRDSIAAGGRRVTTVLVDEVTQNADVGKHALSVIGRSPARDIIDSTWSGVCADMTLRELTRYIGKRFGIWCDTFPTDQPDMTGLVKAFSWENESPWSKLIGECDNQGYIFTSNEAGNLYLWKVASGLRGEGFHITEGDNIRNISWTERGAEQFHEYIVTGASNETSVIDNSCRGNRILTIDITNPLISKTELERRAKTEMQRRKENHTTVTVSGWGLSDEQIKKLGETIRKEIFWNPNFLIPVRIPSLQLRANLLISEVEYMADEASVSCNLVLVNREAYL